MLGRAQAAETGYRRLQAELDLLEPGAGALLVKPRPELLRESERAYLRARSYGRIWSRDVEQARERGVLNPYRWAHEQRAARLRVVARSEASEAFTDAQTRVARQAAFEHPELAAMFVKVWDATLDKRTCPICERAHGSWVRLDEDFPEGEPGSVHDNCHCSWHTEPIDWVL